MSFLGLKRLNYICVLLSENLKFRLNYKMNYVVFSPEKDLTTNELCRKKRHNSFESKDISVCFNPYQFPTIRMISVAPWTVLALGPVVDSRYPPVVIFTLPPEFCGGIGCTVFWPFGIVQFKIPFFCQAGILCCQIHFSVKQVHCFSFPNQIFVSMIL